MGVRIHDGEPVIEVDSVGFKRDVVHDIPSVLVTHGSVRSLQRPLCCGHQWQSDMAAHEVLPLLSKSWQMLSQLRSDAAQ